jgi:anti-sigma factor RsiW
MTEPMAPEEARERFSEALDDALDPTARAAFESALARDEALRAEYADFAATFAALGQLGEADAEDAPDLLAGVQRRLRERSRGRYYRDRYAQRAGVRGAHGMLTLLLTIAAALLLALGWTMLRETMILEDPGPAVEPGAFDPER